MPNLNILLLDGGLGTTLEAAPYHIQFSPATPLWSSHLLLSSSGQETLRAVHRDFVAAGADIVLTATYQASVEGFLKTDSTYTRDDAVRYMRSAIPLARSAFQDQRGSKPTRVALSLGPYGATVTPVSAEYSGRYPAEMDSESALRQWHAARLRLYAEHPPSWTGVEYVAFETVRRADEVRAIRGAVRDVVSVSVSESGGACGRKPWWICGVFPDENVDEQDVRAWVRAALERNADLPRPWGIGLNCTRISHVARILGIMEEEVTALRDEDRYKNEWQAASGRPWLVVYPDGTQGEQYDPATKKWVSRGDEIARRPWDETVAAVIQAVVGRGRWEGLLVGGCCRTEPENIAALRARIGELGSSN